MGVAVHVRLSYAPNMDHVSGSMSALLRIARDHALASVPSRGPMLPFALTDDGRERKLRRCMAERLEDALEQTYQVVSSMVGLESAVIVWDGYFTGADGRSEAIFFEVHESGAANSVVSVQRYRRAGLFTKRILPVGELEQVIDDRPTVIKN